MKWVCACWCCPGLSALFWLPVSCRESYVSRAVSKLDLLSSPPPCMCSLLMRIEIPLSLTQPVWAVRVALLCLVSALSADVAFLSICLGFSHMH